MPLLLFLALCLFQGARGGEETPLPVVLWHGMGDSCCNNHSIGAIATLIRQQLGMGRSFHLNYH